MSDTSQGEGRWLASDGKWYAPEPAAAPAPPAPVATAWQAPAAVAAGGVGLPPGVISANPWIRLGSWFLDGILVFVTLGIGWLIWAAMTAGSGQTPGKKLLNLRVIDSASIRPVGIGKMFWMRGLVGGVVASFCGSIGYPAGPPIPPEPGFNTDIHRTPYIGADPAIEHAAISIAVTGGTDAIECAGAGIKLFKGGICRYFCIIEVKAKI